MVRHAEHFHLRPVSVPDAGAELSPRRHTLLGADTGCWEYGIIVLGHK